MGLLTFLGISAGIVIIGLLAHHGTKKTRAIWRSVAQKYGLEFEDDHTPAGGKMRGRIDDFVVRVECESQSSGPTWTLVQVSGGLIPAISFKPESVWSAAGKLLSGEDVQIGDRGFD